MENCPLFLQDDGTILSEKDVDGMSKNVWLSTCLFIVTGEGTKSVSKPLDITATLIIMHKGKGKVLPFNKCLL